MMFRCSGCGALNNADPGHGGRPVCGRCKQVLDLSGSPQEVDGASLDRSVQSSKVPVLVDFWAPWCGPCRAVAPVVASLAHEKAGRLLVLKLNTESDAMAASRHRIQSIPTFVLFVNGREVSRKSGALPKAALETWIAGAGGGQPSPDA